MKKIMTFIIGAALSISCISTTASAEGFYNVISVIKPDGYEAYGENYEYTSFNKEFNNYKYISYYDFRYNYTLINIKEPYKSDEIYEQYFSKLKFNNVINDGSLELYDNPDEGDNCINPVTVERKYKQLSEICGELYKKDLIDYAYFCDISACYRGYDIYNALYCSFAGTKEELSDIISKYSDNADIKEVRSGIYSVEFFDVDSINKLDEISKSLSDSDGISNGRKISDESMSLKFHASKELNLLDPCICDIDGSGKADISDATIVLSDYAQRMAGVQTVSTENMDANGDGEVNIDDVTYILTYYAEVCVGLR